MDMRDLWEKNLLLSVELSVVWLYVIMELFNINAASWHAKNFLALIFK